MAERDRGTADAAAGAEAGNSDTAAPDRGSIPGAPRWVKIAAVIGVVIVLLVMAMLLIAGGDHGPGRHLGGTSSPAEGRQGITPVEGHVPPANGH